MAKKIMFQGTSSHVGKSILTTALCRILKQDGCKVAPFKAQNMALNSYVTKDGDEIGRAQVAQAEAAGIDPIVQMNPVLLKPTGNQSSQVVLMGRPVGVFSAKEYHTKYSLTALDKVKESLKFLNDNFDVIVIEGAGSPAEVNLKANDIVNMRIAKLAPAPVFLIADIDRGGALASVVGTLELLDSEERDLIKGIVINKFRGDINLLKPALDFLEEKTNKPILGVVPFLDDLGIDNEDSVSLQDKTVSLKMKPINISVIQTPKISNFTDFDALAHEPDVDVRFIKKGDIIGQPDLIILPGSKNTIEDLLYLHEQGYVDDIRHFSASGGPVIGICGGYQMLGNEVLDPLHVEGSLDSLDGLGLLSISTEMKGEKTTNQVTFACKDFSFLNMNFSDTEMNGYEIHMGTTSSFQNLQMLFKLLTRSKKEITETDGHINDNNTVFGTYLHGIFDNDGFRRSLINALRVKKGLHPLSIQFNFASYKESEYNRLAAIVRKNIDMNLFYRILNES